MAQKKMLLTKAVKIGEAARLADLSIDAIRFYQRSGLLRPPERTEGGFRLLGPESLEDLRFIRKSQELGFSLAEIRELLVLQSGRTDACSHVQDLLQKKLATVRGKIAELRRLEKGLRASLSRCERELRSGLRVRHEHCPVLLRLKKDARIAGVNARSKA